MKKLLSILSISAFILPTIINTIACNKNDVKPYIPINPPTSLSKDQQKKDVVNVINNNKKGMEGNNIDTTEIDKIKQLEVNYNKNIATINFDISIVSSLNLFCNYSYAQTFVSGNFNVDLNTNKTSKENINYGFVPLPQPDGFGYVSPDEFLVTKNNSFAILLKNYEWLKFKKISDEGWDYHSELYNLGLINYWNKLTWPSNPFKILFFDLDLKNPSNYSYVDGTIENNKIIINKKVQNIAPTSWDNMAFTDFYERQTDTYGVVMNGVILDQLFVIYKSYKNNEAYGKKYWNTNGIVDVFNINGSRFVGFGDKTKWGQYIINYLENTKYDFTNILDDRTSFILWDNNNPYFYKIN